MSLLSCKGSVPHLPHLGLSAGFQRQGAIPAAGKSRFREPWLSQMLRQAADEVAAFAAFPVSHWKKIWSTNLLERLNKQIKRRTDVVGVFLNPAALLRLAGAVLVEAHDEWQVVDKRYLSESSMATITTPATPPKEVATLPTAALLASTQPCQPRPDRTRPDHARSHELPCSAGQLERARWAM
jgi:hypothetical protein